MAFNLIRLDDKNMSKVIAHVEAAWLWKSLKIFQRSHGLAWHLCFILHIHL